MNPAGVPNLDIPGARPLTARSVLASMLLGTEPPRLPVSRLVRAGGLFGLGEGTVRTALSRMTAAGDVIRTEDGWYALAGSMVVRQERQRVGRAGATVDWSGRWRQAVVSSGPRSAPERSDLRQAMAQLRMGELRDGVWMRPDNLDPDRYPAVRAVIDTQCRWFQVHPDDDQSLASELWDLDGWSETAVVLRRGMARLVVLLERGDTGALADGFVLAAAVLRHMVADPALPRELWPRTWPADALRVDYDRYDAAYRAVLSGWIRGKD